MDISQAQDIVQTSVQMPKPSSSAFDAVTAIFPTMDWLLDKDEDSITLNHNSISLDMDPTYFQQFSVREHSSRLPNMSSMDSSYGALDVSGGAFQTSNAHNLEIGDVLPAVDAVHQQQLLVNGGTSMMMAHVDFTHTRASSIHEALAAAAAQPFPCSEPQVTLYREARPRRPKEAVPPPSTITSPPSESLAMPNIPSFTSPSFNSMALPDDAKYQDADLTAYFASLTDTSFLRAQDSAVAAITAARAVGLEVDLTVLGLIPPTSFDAAFRYTDSGSTMALDEPYLDSPSTLDENEGCFGYGEKEHGEPGHEGRRRSISCVTGPAQGMVSLYEVNALAMFPTTGKARKGSISNRQHPYLDTKFPTNSGPVVAQLPTPLPQDTFTGPFFFGPNSTNPILMQPTSPHHPKKPTPRRKSTSGEDRPSTRLRRPSAPDTIKTPWPSPPISLPSSSPPSSPQLQEKVYSTVCVLELTFPNGLSIMRRKMDGWINATHLLKVAGFMDKAKRTKVLEREVHCCVHEKIQGGYGRYQGTWVPIDAAKELATKFSIHDKIQKILADI